MIPNILLSYHYVKGMDLPARLAKSFGNRSPAIFGDSGAFSAFTSGQPIKLDAYAKWLQVNGSLFEHYSNLDVLGDEDQTTLHQTTLEAMGLTPLPVFHITAEFRYLDALLERYSYIAIGGLVPYLTRPNLVMPKLIQCFKRARGRAVYHGFGVTNWYVLRSFPWYSVDSTSWVAGIRFGKPYIFDPIAAQIIELQVGAKMTSRETRIVREYGFDPRDFTERSRNTRGLLAALSAASYFRAEQHCRQLHGMIPRPGTTKRGLNIYLADVDFRAFTFVNNRMKGTEYE